MVNLVSEENQEKLVDHEENQNEEWFPPELLHIIFSKQLCARDIAVCHTVCKAWQSISITPPFPTPFDHTSDPMFPWLMTHSSLTPIILKYCSFFGPIHHDIYHPHNYIPVEMANAKIRFAKYGWLLMSQDVQHHNQCSFLFNPVTNKRIDLPFGSYLVVMSFTSPPDSSNCLVVGCEGDNLYVHKLGGKRWKSLYFWGTIRCDPRDSNSIVYKGLCYFLSRKGNMYVFDPKDVENCMTVHQKSIPMHTQNSILRTFLVKSKGLLAVLIDDNKKEVHVLKWDRAVKTFLPVKSLGNNMLFISDATVFSQRAMVKGMGNKIYFPNNNGTYTFYSLATKKYHSFLNGKFSQENSYDMEEHQNCFWFKPSDDM
ncbi:hypothetical protein REPUB_Repub02eG0238100 [Reevesia pubescens]